jgi:hypothetical protein
MKKIITIASIISIIVVAFSFFYYFVIFLPKQNIQNQIVISSYDKQKNQLLNSLGQSNKELSSELNCVLDINSKWEALLSQKCPDNSGTDIHFDLSKWINCRANVIESAEFKAITCI